MDPRKAMKDLIYFKYNLNGIYFKGNRQINNSGISLSLLLGLWTS